MAKKTKAKSTKTAGSSWWKERSKIMAMKAETKPKTKKKGTTKKAKKAERGMAYYCEVCGCEMVCVQDSAGNIVCCEQPMSLVC